MQTVTDTETRRTGNGIGQAVFAAMQSDTV